MKEGIYNLFQFFVSISLGGIFTYIAISIVLWDADMPSWTVVQRISWLIGTIVSAIFLGIMLFPSREENKKRNHNDY